MGEAAQILEATRQAREGRLERRDAPIGEHLCRIPVEHFWQWHEHEGVLVPPLARLFPGLISKDADEKQLAWAAFHASEYALPYRVARTPVQVLRAPRR